MSEATIQQLSRRHFVTGVSALGATNLLGLPLIAAAESPPETNRIRIAQEPFICYAPQMLAGDPLRVICRAPLYVAEELLRMEGFSTIEYVDSPNTGGTAVLASGAADLALVGIEAFIPAVDVGRPVVALAGIHAGYLELFANDRIKGIRDLKGKIIPISGIGTPEHMFIARLVADVGMNPERDINWIVTGKTSESMRLFVEGQTDAFLAGPPRAQDLRTRGIGKVILNVTRDQPWSQYLCCLVGANREFVDQSPIATKRALRALLKAVDVCTQEPELVARYLVEKGYESRYALALEVLKELPYRRWHEANPADSLRFYGLRLYEAKMIKSNPQKIVAQGTDWRFLNELKRELKA